MVTDQFAGKEIATAMAIFVNSWPAGVALSLLTLPAIGAAHGVTAVYLAVAAAVALGILLLAVIYQPPAQVAVSRNLGAAGPPHDRRRHGRRPIRSCS